MFSAIVRWCLCLAMLLGLPLLGVALIGQSIHIYLEFPPLTRYVAHAPFDWNAFGLLGLIDFLLISCVIYQFKIGSSRKSTSISRYTGQFPFWGWIGAAIMFAGWILAWSRFSWFSPLQHHTFCIPWSGYILLTNALCEKRLGYSLLSEKPLAFVLLFPASALFWWYFEYLNRFVQNWYYVGIESYGPGGYFFFASLAFATVLPAVLSTHRLLLSFSIFDPGLKTLAPVRRVPAKPTATLVMLTMILGLTLIGVYPDYLYPLVWFAPLLAIAALQTLWGKPTILKPLTRGDWRTTISAAMAALICGFFWEMWNNYSMAHWEYAIPFVDRFHVFKMPLLGYGGYLPFGLECLLFGQLVMGNQTLGLDNGGRPDIQESPV